LASRFAIRGTALAKAADSLADRGVIARLKGAGWMERAALVGLAATARKLVAAHHKSSPLDRGLVLETLRRQLTAVGGADAAQEAILLASSTERLEGEPIVVEGDVARVASFGAHGIDPSVAGIVATAARALADAALKGMTEFGVREATGVTP